MTLIFRDARKADLPAILALLTDDELGRGRDAMGERPAPEYVRAFEEIESDTHSREIVAEQDGRVVGCFQLTFIPGIARKGAKRALIEAVRVASDLRGGGIGEAMMRYAISESRAHGCALIQLTSDNTRKRAHAFYERLGFAQSHLGFKLTL